MASGDAVVWRGQDSTGVLDLFGARAIACLLGDREFVGREWFRFLKWIQSRLLPELDSNLFRV
jgi:hypothetical protein